MERTLSSTAISCDRASAFTEVWSRYIGRMRQKRTGAICPLYRNEDASTRVLDFKKFQEDGAWWRNSLGVNDFLEVKTLVLVGTPCRNLFDLSAEFAIVTGRFLADDDSAFAAFVHRATLAEIHQAIGRLRAHRRVNESLRVVLISNIELDFPVRQVKARELTLDAAGKKERVVIALEGAIRDLKARGEKVTQKVVAALTGIPRGTIAGYWSLLISLVDGLNSKSNNFDKATDVDSEAHLAIAGVLNQMADLPVEELLPSLNEVFFDWLKPSEWATVWDGVSAGGQVAVLRGLAAVLPGRVLEVT